MWAVLTGPLGASRSWDTEAFFRTGVDEITSVLARVRAVGLTPPPGRALDFGCGVGRLTQALAAHFAGVDGVDIAPAMIEQARALTPPGLACTYHLNEADNLALFPDATFDFIYSSITLQHMEPRYSRRYVEEFFRVAKPGGVIVFQLPSEAVPVERPQSRQSGPLTNAGCRARIDAPPALRCAPGAPVLLRVMVRNEGPEVWCSSGRADDGRFSVHLGNHWRGRFGLMRVLDDRRAGLSFDVGPGESIEVALAFTAPMRGRWILELDMVQEEVRWFAQAGSPTARVPVTIDPSLPPGTVEGLPPVMEMHGIPRPEVEALMAACGGVLRAVDRDESTGEGMNSFRYIAQRVS